VGTIVSPCSQRPANCRATKQHWSAAPKQKSSEINNGHQDQHICPFCEWPPTLLLHLPGEMLCRLMTRPMGKWPWRPNTDLPLCQGSNDTPSGRFPSDRNNPAGSLVTGTPAEAKLRATKSLRAWCLDDLPGALLHTKLWRPRASTGSHSGSCVGRKGPTLASDRQQLSLPYRPTWVRMKQSAKQTTSPRSVVKTLPEIMPGDVPCADWILLVPCLLERQDGPRTVVYQVRRLAHYQTWLTNRINSSEESHYQNSDIRPRCQLGGTVCSLLKPRKQGVQAKTHVLLQGRPLWRVDWPESTECR